MRESVCHNCPDRKTPKTCEATCTRRQAEIAKNEEARAQRNLANPVIISSRLREFQRQKVKAIKSGR